MSIAIDILFLAAAVLYVLGGASTLTFLLGARESPGPLGSSALLLGAILHAVHDALRWSVNGVSPWSGIAPALSTLGLFICVLFLLARSVRRTIEVAGAFVAPAVLVALLASRAHARAVPARGPLFSVHISSSLVGLATLTVAAAMAATYLLQERQVKSRRLGGLFHKLPPLDTLDTLTFRFVAIGIPALTLGVVTGHVVGVGLNRARGLPWQQYFAMTTWVIFVGVLLLRLLAGWRGRRAAIGTLVGFASSVMVLLAYVARGVRS